MNAEDREAACRATSPQQCFELPRHVPRLKQLSDGAGGHWQDRGFVLTRADEGPRADARPRHVLEPACQEFWNGLPFVSGERALLCGPQRVSEGIGNSAARTAVDCFSPALPARAASAPGPSRSASLCDAAAPLPAVCRASKPTASRSSRALAPATARQLHRINQVDHRKEVF